MRWRRPNATADFERVLEILQAYDRSVYGDSDWTEEELREQWDEIDLERDAWLAVDGDVVAGVMHLCEIRGGRMIVDGYVHPDHTGRGAGAMLLDAVEIRAREIEPGLSTHERVYLEAAHLVGDMRAPPLFVCKGYRRVRTFFRMVRGLAPSEPRPAFPAGLELRPLDPSLHGPAVHAAVEEAFAGEWSHRYTPYAEWKTAVFGWARFDPELVPVVWDGAEIAAVSLNYEKRMGDWGWVGTLAVRPRWRRRGLGQALLQESFHRFARRGETTAALGVDSENPTGATRLYERAGMEVLWRADVWQKDLPTGGERAAPTDFGTPRA